MKKYYGTGFYIAAKTKAFKERQAKKEACEEAEAVGTIVFAGGSNAITEKDKDKAIKNNLDEQSKLLGGAGRRVTGGLSHLYKPRRIILDSLMFLLV